MPIEAAKTASPGRDHGSDLRDQRSEEFQSRRQRQPAGRLLHLLLQDPLGFDLRILMGGEDEDFVDDKKRDSILGTKADKLEKTLKRLTPSLNFRTDFAWAGTFGETKDGLPYIGKHPNFPSAYFVLGFGGNGITFSVIGMDMVARMLKGEAHPLDEYVRFRR